MYNNQGRIYSIAEDMCYENKMMTNSATSIGPPSEAVLLTLSNERQQPACDEKRSSYKPSLAAVINVLVIIVVGITLGFIEFDIIPTNQLGYYCKDPTIAHPFKGDTITATWLILGSFLGPLVILFLVEYRKSDPKQSVRVVWCWYREMLIGLTATLMVTEVMKAIVGEPRPHFLTTCRPNTEATCENGTFVKTFQCTSSGYGMYLVGDSSRSFPSGHTSISVFVSIFCVAFIHYRLKTRKVGQLLKPFLIVLFLSWGAVCGLTRITDRRHHWWDVLAGTILGIIGVSYTIIALVKRFQLSQKISKSPVSSRSTILEPRMVCVM